MPRVNNTAPRIENGPDENIENYKQTIYDLWHGPTNPLNCTDGRANFINFLNEHFVQVFDYIGFFENAISISSAVMENSNYLANLIKLARMDEFKDNSFIINHGDMYIMAAVRLNVKKWYNSSTDVYKIFLLAPNMYDIIDL